MKYTEYLFCAEKHLKGCASLLLSYKSDVKYDRHVWLELYYLSGYIIEGITIYSAYKIHNWSPSLDIKQCDKSFTLSTGLDFYYDRKAGKTSVFPGRSFSSLSVQGHHFQDIVKNLLRVDPSFDDIPYLGNGEIDRDVERLIDCWKPEVRYNYHGSPTVLPNLNHDLIAKLFETCCIIYLKHI